MEPECEPIRSDPDLARLVDRHGAVTIQPAADPFKRFLVSIVRQQVSMDAAAAIEERLFRRIDPSPDGVLMADESQLRDAGLSAAKVEYARSLARRWQRGNWGPAYFDGRSDEDVLDEVTEVRGIGPWTGKMFLIFGLGRPDVFPVEDLGIRRAMRTLYDEDLSRSEMSEMASRWAPCRSYASEYLWRSID